MIFMGFIARAPAAAIRTTRRAAWLAALTLSLTACGYKGDLTHPAAHVHPYTAIAPIDAIA